MLGLHCLSDNLISYLTRVPTDCASLWMVASCLPLISIHAPTMTCIALS